MEYNVITTRHYRGAKAVWYVTDLLQILLLVRFFLKILDANPNASFTNFIYQVTYSFAYPFFGVFNSTPLQNGGVFEWNTLLAMLAFYILAMIIVRLFFTGNTVYTHNAVV